MKMAPWNNPTTQICCTKHLKQNVPDLEISRLCNYHATPYTIEYPCKDMCKYIDHSEEISKEVF